MATTTTTNIHMVETRDALLIVVVVVVPSLHRSTRQSKAKQNQSQAREAKTVGKAVKARLPRAREPCTMDGWMDGYVHIWTENYFSLVFPSRNSNRGGDYTDDIPYHWVGRLLDLWYKIPGGSQGSSSILYNPGSRVLFLIFLVSRNWIKIGKFSQIYIRNTIFSQFLC